MIITSYESFNEVNQIDLNLLKQKALEFSKTDEARKILSDLDLKFLSQLRIDLNNLIKKWKSVDKIIQKLLSHSFSKNEGIFSTIIITIFGSFLVFDRLMRLVKIFKDNGSYLKLLPFGYTASRPMAIDLILTFLILTYSALNFLPDKKNFTTLNNYRATTISSIYDGIHDYVFTDLEEKKYQVKYIGGEDFEIFYQGKKIGYLRGDVIMNLNKQKILYKTKEIPNSAKVLNIGLDELLLSDITPEEQKEIINREKEIRKKEEEINRISYEIDSIYYDKPDTNAGTLKKENVEQSKKLFKDFGLDYKEVLDKTAFWQVRKVLESANMLNYLGFFSKLFINILKDYGAVTSFINDIICDKLIEIFNTIRDNKDIINKIRNSREELCSIFDFSTIEETKAALNKLQEWRKINNFIKNIPSTQKNLIWQNGWYNENLSVKDRQYFEWCLKKIITKENDTFRKFFSEISAYKTLESLKIHFKNVLEEEPWLYEYWLDKLNNTKNVYVTWHSPEKKQIICVVHTFSAIKKIAYMTNWCIKRESSSFNSVTKNGFQFILYSFDVPLTDKKSVIGFTLNNPDDPLQIGLCYNKVNQPDKLPHELLTKAGRHFLSLRDPGHPRLDSIKPEYVNINYKNMLQKFNLTFVKQLRRYLRKSFIGTLADIWLDD